VTKPAITLSIVSHGDLENIRKLLKSLAQYEDGKNLQVIITDNLGENLPAFDASPWASLLILRNPKVQGFAHNHNQAFQHADGEYFCVLNPDILFTQPVFSVLIQRINEQNALLAPLIFDAEKILQDSFRKFPTPLELLKRKMPAYRFSPLPPDEKGLIHPDWIAGMFIFMKGDTYRRLGGFDEKFHLYFEDVDFCARAARDLGLPALVDTSLHLQHNAQRASRSNLRYFLWHVQSAALFFTSNLYRDLRKKTP